METCLYSIFFNISKASYLSVWAKNVETCLNRDVSTFKIWYFSAQNKNVEACIYSDVSTFKKYATVLHVSSIGGGSIHGFSIILNKKKLDQVVPVLSLPIYLKHPRLIRGVPNVQKHNEINKMDSDENNTESCVIRCFQTALILAQTWTVWIEDEKFMLMVEYFSICFHIPLSNRDVSTNGHLVCGFTKCLS